MSWDDKYAPVIREMIKQENDVINHRLTWLGTMQGLLFASMALLWSEEVDSIIYVLGGLGILISLSSLLALCFANEAIVRLCEDWEKNKTFYTGPPVIGYSSKILRYLLPWFMLPILFSIAWVIVIMVRSSSC